MSYHFVECECTHKKYFNWRVEYLNSWEHWQMQDTAAWHPAQRLANGTRQNRNEVPVFPDYLKQTHTQTKTQRAKGKSNEAPNTHDMWLSRAKRESESCSSSSSSSIPFCCSSSAPPTSHPRAAGKTYVSGILWVERALFGNRIWSCGSCDQCQWLPNVLFCLLYTLHSWRAYKNGYISILNI